MVASEIKKKAIPYYACFVGSLMSTVSAITSSDLQQSSWFNGSEHDSPRFLLEDSELLAQALHFLEERGVVQFLKDDFGPDIIAKVPTSDEAMAKLYNEPGTVFHKFKLA